MSKSPLLKASSFIIQREDAVVIDTNERMAAKIEEIASSLENLEQDDFGDSFSEGIEAVQVAALLSDEGESALEEQQHVPYEGPAPEELIAQAEAEIHEMRTQAEAELEQLRAQIMQEASEEGHRQGFEQGYQEGLNRASMENEARQRELDELSDRLMKEYERKIAELEPSVVQALTGIYEHIFDVDLSGHRNVIMHLIENTLHRIDGCENYLIRVSKDDFAYVSMQKQSVLEQCVVGSAKLEVVEDITLTANECLIETESGIYDCSVGTELKELKKQLMLLSYKEEQ